MHNAYDCIFVPAGLGNLSAPIDEQDLSFYLSPISYKNCFHERAHQHEPGDAEGIGSQDIAQIMIAVEDAAKTFKEDQQNKGDACHPLPKAGRHLGHDEIRQKAVADHSAEGVSAGEGGKRCGAKSQLFCGTMAGKIVDDEILDQSATLRANLQYRKFEPIAL